MDKKAIRKKYKELRKALSNDERDERSLAIANQLLKIPIWDKTYYHLFLTISELLEVETEFVLQVLAGKDKEIVVSKCEFKTVEMLHFLLTENTKIKKNSFNIPEPVNGLEVPVSKIEVVFVPLLAFDTKGNRIGYGKGFYDKFLSECKPNTIKVGLSFFEAEAEDFETHALDQALNYVITPQKVYQFSS